MVATRNSTEEAKRRTIIALTSNGANVRAWEVAFQATLQIENQSHFLLPEYSIPVPAHLTLALSVEVQMSRAIKASRSKEAAQRTLDKALGEEGGPKAATTPVVQLKISPPGTRTRSMLKPTPLKIDNAGDAQEEEAAKVKQEADKVQEEHEAKHDSVQEGKAHARAVREGKMRARAAKMAARLAETQGAIAERRGGQLMVCYLDPLTALALDDDEDLDTVCHEHTFMGETMRYAVEEPEQAQVRMHIDGLLTRSLSAIPTHVTTGVEPGNIHERYKRVVVFYDDITRKVLIEQIDDDLHEVSMRERESFAAFTSRFRGIEHRMLEVGMKLDQELLLAKLEKSLRASKNGGVLAVLQQVKLVIGLKIDTTKDLFSAMADPMRDYEKDHKVEQEKVKAAQEKVNALHAGERGKGGRGQGQQGRGRGGKGGKGGNATKSKSPCLRFAEGSCTHPNCHFTHVALNAEAIKELKAKMAAAKAAKTAGGGTTPQPKRGGGGHTVMEVTHALKAEVVTVPLIDKIKALKEKGLTEQQILTVAHALLGKQ